MCIPASACWSRVRADRRWTASCGPCSKAAAATAEARAMLLELADLLRGQVSVLHLFQYVTFRTIMSALTAVAPVEGRHADDGRRADPARGHGRHVAVGRPAQSLHLGHARRDAGVRRGRLLRRLQEARAQGQPWPCRALEVFLAVGVWSRRC